MIDIETVDGERLQIGAKGVVDQTDRSADPVDAEQIELCIRWFAGAKPTPEPTVSSFWLKHVVEHWAGTAISNGAVILAAQRVGLPIARDAGSRTASATIGVSADSINEFDCGCGHP